MLTPRSDDKNRAKELERKKKEPWTFGMEPDVPKSHKEAAEALKNANTKK